MRAALAGAGGGRSRLGEGRLEAVDHSVAADAAGEALRGRGAIADPQEIFAAQLDIADTERARRFLHLPLVGEGRLRGTKAAERAVRRVIGGDGATADAGRFAAIGPGRVENRAR